MDERILWVHIEKSHVDDALAERNTTYLANLIPAAQHLSPEVRAHLADVIFGLLTGGVKFPRRRPKKQGLEYERERIAEKVWVTASSVMGLRSPAVFINRRFRILLPSA